MVTLKFEPRYICSSCKKDYDSEEIAKKCEEKGFSNKYDSGDKVRISSAPHFDNSGAWIHAGRGSYVPFDLYKNTGFTINTLLIEKETHKPKYLIKEIFTEERKKSLSELQTRVIDLVADKRRSKDDLYENAKRMSEEEFIESWSNIFLIPEDCLSQINSLDKLTA